MSEQKPDANEQSNAEEQPDAKDKPDAKDQKEGMSAPFILYLQGAQHEEALRGLTLWVHHLLLPVYAREVTSNAPWCPRWWEHPEAVAQLYGLWMAWQELTDARAGMTGPGIWHRDYLTHVMNAIRDPSGPFAGCKPGGHRPKEPPKPELLRP